MARSTEAHAAAVQRIFSHHQGHPRPVQHGGRVELAPVLQSSLKRPSVLRVRADCGARLFLAKFAVVLHYLLHQMLDHLLPDEPDPAGLSFLRLSSRIASMTSSAFPRRMKRWRDRPRHALRQRCRFQRICRRHLYIGASV